LRRREESLQAVAPGCNAVLSLWTADLLVFVQMLSNCVFKVLQRVLLSRKKDAADSKHRLDIPTERRG